jgi:hypothetical protein
MKSTFENLYHSSASDLQRLPCGCVEREVREPKERGKRKQKKMHVWARERQRCGKSGDRKGGRRGGGGESNLK